MTPYKTQAYIQSLNQGLIKPAYKLAHRTGYTAVIQYIFENICLIRVVGPLIYYPRTNIAEQLIVAFPPQRSYIIYRQFHLPLLFGLFSQSIISQ